MKQAPWLSISDVDKHNVGYLQLGRSDPLNFSSELLEGIKDIRPLKHSLLDFIIHGNQFRHQIEHLIKKLARNSNHAFQRITENNITLSATQNSAMFNNTTNSLQKRKTYRRHRHTTKGNRHIPSPRFSLRGGSNRRSSTSPNLTDPDQSQGHNTNKSNR